MARRRQGPRLDTAALYAALQRRRAGQSLREFCREIGGTSPSTLVRMSKGYNPSADALVRFLLYLGTTDLGEFMHRGGDDG